MSENDNHSGIPQDIIDAAEASAAKSLGDEASERGLEGDLEKLQALLDDSTTRAAQTQERLKETHERYLRVAADFDNFRKRAAKEREETVKLANERLAKELLPVVDNLERALATAGENDPLREGVKLVLKQFTDALGRFGVTSFPSVGTPFDPAKHEALMQQETADVPVGHVSTELTKGYLIHERLLRPAAVVVAKAPAREAEPPGDSESPTA